MHVKPILITFQVADCCCHRKLFLYIYFFFTFDNFSFNGNVLRVINLIIKSSQQTSALSDFKLQRICATE